MNNKTTWWIVGVVVVIVLIVVVAMNSSGAGAPVASNSGQPAQSPNTTSSNTTSQPASQNTGNTSLASLQSLLRLGIPEQCTVSSLAASGTVYVTSGHMRGDFTSNSSAGQIASHMITDGQTAYVWMGNSAQGYKMSFSSLSSPSATSRGSVNLNTQMNESCTPWPVDQSEFTPPSNITFMDVSSMMRGVTPP